MLVTGPLSERNGESLDETDHRETIRRGIGITDSLSPNPAYVLPRFWQGHVTEGNKN